MPAAPVTVADVARQDVPVQLNQIGTVEAYNSVTVKSRVSGQIAQVHVVEGQSVKQGDPLFTIDRRPFQAALAQAQATLERDRALARNAQANAQRQAELFQQKLLSPADYDLSRANAEAQEATVKADQAIIENAQLQLAYCQIQSPLDGRAGALLINQGNVVKNDDTSLLVINQLQPIYLSFTVPEQELASIRRFSSEGKLPVTARAAAGHDHAEQGVLSFIDNQVDRATGTIRLKAEFPNADGDLWPGQYVNVTLTLTAERNALVVPTPAIQVGQGGQFVFVVRDDQTADMRPVQVVREVGGTSVVQGNLEPGQRVVTDGQLRLRPGAAVQVQAAPAPATRPATAQAMN